MRTTPTCPLTVLYEDESLLVVQKPSGMPTQPDPSGDPDLLSALQALYGDVFLIHRLDRTVGGVMVFARTASAAATLSRAVASHTDFEKHYIAIVSGVRTGCEPLADLLFHDTRARRAFVVDRMRAGVKEASLVSTAVATEETPLGTATLCEVQLHTGRFHQIRVQLAARKTPILGDGKYGSRVKCPLALFAYRLVFSHPVTGRRLSFTASPDDVTPWNFFAEQIAALKNL